MFSKGYQKLGEIPQVWLNKFKIAIAAKDGDAIDKLLSEIPSFENIDEARNALFLVKEATVVIQNLQNETSLHLRHLKKHIEFLDSTQESGSSKLDIKS